MLPSTIHARGAPETISKVSRLFNGSLDDSVRDLRDVILSALLVTRPGTDGSFPVADFATLHGNLTQAWPEEAATARAWLAEGGGAAS